MDINKDNKENTIEVMWVNNVPYLHVGELLQQLMIHNNPNHELALKELCLEILAKARGK